MLTHNTLLLSILLSTIALAACETAPLARVVSRARTSAAEDEASAEPRSIEIRGSTSSLKTNALPYEGRSIRVLTCKCTDSNPRRWAPEFERLTGAKVEVVSLPFGQLFDEISSDLTSRGGFFDAYIYGPQWQTDLMGEKDPETGEFNLMSLTELVKNDDKLQWTDIAHFFREYSTSFQGQVYNIPLDGDVHYLHYRQDVLDMFGLQVPRTWEDYVNVAKTVHGSDMNGDGVPDYGSCISKMKGQQSYWFIVSVLAGFLQSKGTGQGVFFDVDTMEPMIRNEAVEYALELFRSLEPYSIPFETVNVTLGTTRESMYGGRCAMTLDWGDVMFGANKSTAARGDIYVARMPGSTRVLDRSTMKLTDCNDDLCPFADAETGVNHAPYAAFGGWSGAVNNFISDENKRIAYDFISFMSSPDQANVDIGAGQGYEPYRFSQLTTQFWDSLGFLPSHGQNIVNQVTAVLESRNTALDLRIRATVDYQQRVLDSEIHKFLSGESTAAEFMDSVHRAWEEITEEQGRALQRNLYRASIGLPDYQPPLVVPEGETIESWVIGVVAGGSALFVLIAAALAWSYARKNRIPVWIINPKDLELKEVIGLGGSAVVHRGIWKGAQEVAVKIFLDDPSKARGGLNASVYATADVKSKFLTSSGPSKVTPMSTNVTSPLTATENRSSTYLATSNDVTSRINKKARAQAIIAETEILASIRHPHVLFLYGTVKLDQGQAIVVEYMKDGSLYDVLANVTMPLPWKQRTRMALDLAQGLRFLHANHIMHCDIKSLNCLVDSSMTVKLADFGLSSSKRSAVKGYSIPWASPEVATAKRNDVNAFTDKSDIYSFGVTMWEIASRKRPYADFPNAASIREAISSGDIPPTTGALAEGWPEGLGALIRDCLDMLPESRPTMDEIVSRLSDIYENVDESDTGGTLTRFEDGQRLASMFFTNEEISTFKTTGKIAAKAIPRCSVLFSDIVGFTSLSSKLSATRVAEVLDDLFSRFDEIAARHNVLKIETIGDAFIAGAGLSNFENQHAVSLSLMALEMVAAAREITVPETGLPLQIRVGCHVGPVSATLVGRSQTKFTLLGDTMNMASRLESTANVGVPQISAPMRDTCKGAWQELGVKCVLRGKQDLKGKGSVSTFEITKPDTAKLASS